VWLSPAPRVSGLAGSAGAGGMSQGVFESKELELVARAARVRVRIRDKSGLDRI